MEQDVLTRRRRDKATNQRSRSLRAAAELRLQDASPRQPQNSAVVKAANKAQVAGQRGPNFASDASWAVHPPLSEATAPRKSAPLQGLAASDREVRAAYNCIDPGLSQELNALLAGLIDKSEKVSPQRATGSYILVERCHNCEVHHGLTTRHNEQQYKQVTEALLKNVVANGMDLVLGAEEFCCQLETAPRCLGHSHLMGQHVWHHASRIGALEVYMLTPEPWRHSAGGIAWFPGSSPSLSASGPSLQETWGARTKLAVSGYNVTLLHSKLSSRAWPTEQQVLKRLIASFPQCSVSIHVTRPSGRPLQQFDVKVKAKAYEATEELSFSGEGADGACHVLGIPLLCELEVHVRHHSMSEQKFKLKLTRVRTDYFFNADVIYRLWVVKVPAGLAIYASPSEVQAHHLPARAVPFEGTMQWRTGAQEHVMTNGSIRYPWEDFQPQAIRPVAPFKDLVQVSVAGYYSAIAESSTTALTMDDIEEAECLQIALLHAPVVEIQVTLPGGLPAEGVRLQVDEECQVACTDGTGICKLHLPPGTHTARMFHASYTATWIERRLDVKPDSPAMKLSLPLRFQVWASPILAKCQVVAHDVWLTLAGSAPEQGWQPYTGALHLPEGLRLADQLGIIEFDASADAGARSTGGMELVAKLSLASPHIQAPSAGSTDAEEDHSMPEQAPEQMRPRLLGTVTASQVVQEHQAQSQGSSPVIAHALTCCCAEGVPDVRLSSSGQLVGKTDQNGVCAIDNLGLGRHEVSVYHQCIGTKEVQYSAVTVAEGVCGLPLLFPAHIYLYVQGHARGSLSVSAGACAAKIPSGAKAFPGRLLRPRTLQLNSSEDEGSSPGAATIAPLDVLVEKSEADGCPVLQLQVDETSLPGWKWVPAMPPRLSASSCGLLQLIKEGSITLGFLKNTFTVMLAGGERVELALEDYCTVADVGKSLQPGDHHEVQLACNQRVLQNEELVQPGQELTVLSTVEVSFNLCGSGLPVQNVCISLDCPCSSPATTGSDGSAQVACLPGQRVLTASHDLLLLHGGQHQVNLNNFWSSKSFSLPAALRFYARCEEDGTRVVFVALGERDVPQDAIAACGQVHLKHPGAGVAEVIDLPDDRLLSVQLKGGSTEVAPYPVEEITFVHKEFPAMVWVPHATSLLATRTDWTQLLEGPLMVGKLHAAVVLEFTGFQEAPPVLKLPVTSTTSVAELRMLTGAKSMATVEGFAMLCDGKLLAEDEILPSGSVVAVWAKAAFCGPGGPTFTFAAGAVPAAGAIVQSLARALGLEEDAIGLFDGSGTRLADPRARCVGSCYSARLLGPVVVQVDLPPTASAASEGLPDVRVEVDGQHYGSTDALGRAQVHVPIGAVDIILRHPCFGKEGQTRSITASSGTEVEIRVWAHLRLYIYATLPEDEEEPLEADVEEVDGGDDPFASSAVVWVCADPAHIPEDAVGVAAEVTAIASSGKAITKSLQEDMLSDFVFRFEEPSQAQQKAPIKNAGFLSSLRLAVQRKGYMWSPKDPSPLQQREEEIGGNEYLRLLACPVAMGFLEPSLKVHSTTRPATEVSLAVGSHAGSLLAWLCKEWALSEGTFVLMHKAVELPKHKRLLPGMDVELVQVEVLSIQVVSACCGEAVAGMNVLADGSKKAVTDARGMVSLSMTVGIHSITLEHTCLGQTGRIAQQVTVRATQANTLVFEVPVVLYAYIMDPDMEDVDDTEDPMNLVSQAWVGVDPTHIPEEAKPPSGCVCSDARSRFGERKVKLNGQLNSGVSFPVSAKDRVLVKGPCSVSWLRFQFAQSGMIWEPKDPTPLEERTQEIGGCEFMRLLACPVVVGFLKPSVKA